MELPRLPKILDCVLDVEAGVFEPKMDDIVSTEGAMKTDAVMRVS